MLVRFRVNLGSRDAESLGVDFRKCSAGMTCDVPDAAAQWLVKRRIAEPVTVRGVAKPAEISQSKPAPLAAKVKPSEKTNDKEA